LPARSEAIDTFGTDLQRSAAVDVVRLLGPDGTRAEIVPEWGGSVLALELGGRPVLDPAPFDEIARKPTSYGIPILFPFPNRIRDGRFSFAGVELKIDPPRHGFVRDKPWRVTGSGAGETEAWLTLRLDARDHAEAILAQFPFPFELEVAYRLRARALELAVTARNLGSRAMPAGFGIHPYFQAPTGGSVSVPAGELWELSDSLPTGRIVPVDDRRDLRQPRPIAGLALDDLYTGVACGADGLARCEILDPGNDRRTVIEFDSRSLPEVVVYTPPSRRAICIEPQSCPTDGFNLAARGIDAHVVRLGPRGVVRWSVVIRDELTAASPRTSSRDT
jgi:aldose 1-epimerase